MPVPLARALDDLRPLLSDPDRLVRAIGSGRRRGATLQWRRVELRPVDLKNGRRLQVVCTDERQAHTANYAYDSGLTTVLGDLLALPFGNWHVDTIDETVQLRVSKKGEAFVHRHAAETEQRTSHDRGKAHLLDPGDPLFDVIGGGGDKRRQVDAFLRALAPVLPATPTDGPPLRVVDLGCGNAYLTFAAFRYLTAIRDLPVEFTGVDVKAQARERNGRLAERLGYADRLHFVEGTILAAPLDGADVVLALHACDTATDEALARAVLWRSPVVLAAPCCHHDLQRQLAATTSDAGAPRPYDVLVRQPILRERFGDVLTDALRAAILRVLGYRVDVVEFVDSRHTPRNLLIRATRTDSPASPELVDDYQALVRAWRVRPRLADLLATELSTAGVAVSDDVGRG